MTCRDFIRETDLTNPGLNPAPSLILNPLEARCFNISGNSNIVFDAAVTMSQDSGVISLLQKIIRLANSPDAWRLDVIVFAALVVTPSCFKRELYSYATD